ncbi:inositol phosphorylceramide synthase [Chitinophaga agrisoli]|uniref:Inositol phosphorylceramide synthase n=1 Tax=Chitinophaga agrisoli TaxID=2607653 RepID=A0A5B2VT78_9BACT|nr:phosphatase PAP2 family protein [Chitinophaga agrisoli]KAA2241486.1 inositol phosphorylceramide synthase [Chitinophaga agrisoli]
MDTLSTVTPVSFYNRKTLIITSLISVGYLLLSALLVGFKTDQLVLVGIFNSLFYISKGTRKFIIGFSIFIVYWILYDYMKAFPNYEFGKVHIASVYYAERNIFGIASSGGILTPNEYWLAHSNAFLDVLCGLFYLCWIPLPLAFAAYLFYANRVQFFHFMFIFLFVNLLGFVVYYTFPAAPPWYVQLHGFDLIPHTPGNTAGLARFDQFFQVSIFKGLYAKGSNVFAAMPSLHSAYPLIVLVFAWRTKSTTFKILSTIVTAGIWFAAVYTSHHYILDVLAGILTAGVGIFLYHRVLCRRYFFISFLQYLYRHTT